MPNANQPVRLEYKEGSSKKFWEISATGKSVTVRFGRIGAAGQTQTKAFPTEAAAKHEMEKLIAQKRKKGYKDR